MVPQKSCFLDFKTESFLRYHSIWPRRKIAILQLRNLQVLHICHLSYIVYYQALYLYARLFYSVDIEDPLTLDKI